MNQIDAFLDKIADEESKGRLSDILNHIKGKYPQLELAVKWNQPMFMDHGTFIIGFSVASNHTSVAPEQSVNEIFKDEIARSGYEKTKMFFKIRKTDEVDYGLLDRVIEFNINDKKFNKGFWRK